jgi:hypothetical protein
MSPPTPESKSDVHSGFTGKTASFALEGKGKEENQSSIPG